MNTRQIKKNSTTEDIPFSGRVKKMKVRAGEGGGGGGGGGRMLIKRMLLNVNEAELEEEE